MNRLGRILGRLAILVMVLAVLALLALWALQRLPPTAAQRSAMVLMNATSQATLTGRNAWPALWFLNQAVPEADMQALAQADFADWRAWMRAMPARL